MVDQVHYESHEKDHPSTAMKAISYPQLASSVHETHPAREAFRTECGKAAVLCAPGLFGRLQDLPGRNHLRNIRVGVLPNLQETFVLSPRLFPQSFPLESLGQVVMR